MAPGVGKYGDEEENGGWGVNGGAAAKRQPSFAGAQVRRYRVWALFFAVVFVVVCWWNGWGFFGDEDGVDWSRFAYVLYATDVHTVCNAYMVFEALHRLGSKAERVLLYPEEWQLDRPSESDRGAQLLSLARSKYGVRLKPIQLLGLDGPADAGTFDRPSTWETSITKLRIFEQVQYKRVLYFDSDVLLHQHMDELFLLPSAAVAMPRRYWSELPHWDWPLSGTLMLVEPDAAETRQLWERLQGWRLSPERADCKTYDDDLLDDRFRSSALVLPHRPYILQTSELRKRDHDGYLGIYGSSPDHQKWDAYNELQKAKLIHFDDWPLPKPWRMWPTDGVMEIQPDCGGSHEGTCGEREVWKGLYDEFRQRRKDICRILSVPAPQNWKKYKEEIGATT